MNKLILNAINKDGVNITDLHKLIPIIKGDKTLYLNTPVGYNENIVILKNVSKRFKDTFNHMLMRKQIEVNFVDPWIFMAEESPMYTNLMQGADMHTNRECWMPVQVKTKNPS